MHICVSFDFNFFFRQQFEITNQKNYIRISYLYCKSLKHCVQIVEGWYTVFYICVRLQLIWMSCSRNNISSIKSKYNCVVKLTYFTCITKRWIYIYIYMYTYLLFHLTQRQEVITVYVIIPSFTNKISELLFWLIVRESAVTSKVASQYSSDSHNLITLCIAIYHFKFFFC